MFQGGFSATPIDTPSAKHSTCSLAPSGSAASTPTVVPNPGLTTVPSPGSDNTTTGACAGPGSTTVTVTCATSVSANTESPAAGLIATSVYVVVSSGATCCMAFASTATPSSVTE